MDSAHVVTALQREKKLLEQVLHLAECQLELAQAGRFEDFELLLSLRAGAMSEFALSEVAVGTVMPRIENNDRVLPIPELQELLNLNLQIISLADRIANIDEKAEQLAELHEPCLSPEKYSAQG